MFRKNHFTFLLAIALFFVSGSIVFAQTAPVSGRVEMKKADNTTELVSGAMVEVFRTDQKGKFPAAKTGRKGDFAFAGLPLGATFAFSVSGPKLTPRIVPNIRAGAENLVIVVTEGDGKRLTEDEVRQSFAAPPATGKTGEAKTEKSAGEMTAEQKKAQEEYLKKVAEVESKNKKIGESTVVIKRTLEEGSKAFDAKNYDLAIAKFDEGITADPDFAGSAPILLNNKALALTIRATNNYNQAIKADAATKASAMVSVKKDFAEAAAASDKSIEILKTATAPDAAIQKNYDDAKFNALINRKEAYRLMVKTGADRNKAKEALVAFQEYIAAEPDAKKKSDSQLALAEALQDSNDFDQAVIEFEKILVTDAKNVDALAGAGFSLVNVGYINNDKEKLQQGANYLQKFAEVAPDAHKYKDDAKALLDSLKKEQNVAPQKTTKKKP